MVGRCMPRACEESTPRQAGRARWSAIVTDLPEALSFNGIVSVHGNDCPEHATAESGRGIGSGFCRRASRQGGHAPPLRYWMCASAAGLSVQTRPPPSARGLVLLFGIVEGLSVKVRILYWSVATSISCKRALPGISNPSSMLLRRFFNCLPEGTRPMTIGTYAVFTLTGGLVLFKLAIMAFATALLARTLSSRSKPIKQPAALRGPSLQDGTAAGS